MDSHGAVPVAAALGGIGESPPRRKEGRRKGRSAPRMASTFRIEPLGEESGLPTGGSDEREKRTGDADEPGAHVDIRI
jgi:hypothetical protein